MPLVERVAIVGLAIRFPGGQSDPGLFWEQVQGGQDCSREVPAGRWLLPPETCMDDRKPHPDSVYNSRGYYLDPFEPNLRDLTISADLVQQLDPLFHLVLDVGRQAFRSARMLSTDPRKVGVILGNICLPTEKSSELAWEYLGGQAARVLGQSAPARQTHPWNRYVAGLPAALLARALGLGGGTFTLDAACASSLYAIKLACDELLSGRADAMLAGGSSRPDCLYTQMGFSQLRALSASGKCSPFDAAADGLMVGEGAGIFVLKRLSDALKTGDLIHGVICGAGLSNDRHGNLLAPAKEGQLRAMRQAYEQANWKVNYPDLIECHATGTPVGDAIEFESLRELWGEDGWVPGQCVLGSVKSTVGHLLTGAGSAALAKVLLSMTAQVRPPQANFNSPAPGLRYHDGPFKILNQAEAWHPRRPAVPRRAAVSGFGFGGVNAHLLVEEYIGQTYLEARKSGTVLVPELRSVANRPVERPPEKPLPNNDGIAIVGLAVHAGPWESLAAFQQQVLGGERLVTPTPKQTGWQLAEEAPPSGYYVESVRVPLERFRIPPKELEEMLPQQLLMLNVAAAALDDCTGHYDAPPEGDPNTGVFIGTGLDLNTTNFHLRWQGKKLLQSVPAEERTPEFESQFLEAISPALNANRTMGALGSIAASRIARAFGFGGPSFTLCNEDTSSLKALELAVRQLRNRELNRAVVGGVDLAGDPRAILATSADRPFGDLGQASPLNQNSAALAGEGAVALVLKRLDEAQRDGDRVYAIIKGVGGAIGGSCDRAGPDAAAYASSLMRACADGLVDPQSLEYLEASATGTPIDDQPEAEAVSALLKAQQRQNLLMLSAVRGQVGQLGAASGLAGVVKAALAIYHQVLPPSTTSVQLVPALEAVSSHCHWSSTPRFWLKDNTAPRRAIVASTSPDGNVCHAILEESPTPNWPATPVVRGLDALFIVEGDRPEQLLKLLNELAHWAEPRASQSVAVLAQEWLQTHPRQPTAKLAVTLVPRDTTELLEQVSACWEAIDANPTHPIPNPTTPELRQALRDRVFYNPNPLGNKAKIAYVFPGSGNQFPHMGQELGVRWPQLLRQQQTESQRLQSQYAPKRFWQDQIPFETSARECLFGQVTLGTLTADLLKLLQIRSDVLIGQSLGESAGLFGLRVWSDRDEMLQRIEISTLFTTDLGPPYNAARQFFGLQAHQPSEWVSGVLAVPADDVRAAMRPGLKAYLLIVTTPTECVVGGLKADVEQLVSQFAAPFFPLQGVTLAHCEVGRPVEAAYRELHTLPTTPQAGLTIISGAAARPYKPTPSNCADSITAGLLNTIDFPAVIEAAYREGVRFFLEVGPGNSCTRMISATLAQRPHVARAMTIPRQDAVSLTYRLVAQLISERVSVEVAPLFSISTEMALTQTAGRSIVLPVGMPGGEFPRFGPEPEPEPERLPELPLPVPTPIDTPRPVRETLPQIATPAPREVLTPYPETLRNTPEPRVTFPNPEAFTRPKFATEDRLTEILEQTPAPVRRTEDVQPEPVPGASPLAFTWASSLTPYVEATVASQQALAQAHDSFLRLQQGFADLATQALMNHTELLRRLMGQPEELVDDAPPRSLNTEQCFEFARGRIGDVLGPMYAEIDAFPTRVRLPDGPLMLVDNILQIEGEPCSLTRGNVVTDHYVHANRWYLDAGRIPTCVAVESGQADLFLSGFLGIDKQTRGLAVYRLLDAVVTFHAPLPGIGDRIVYDIHIDEFFHQSDTWLFRFRFEATVNGEPLMSMSNGVAGFFTEAALAAGQGIVKSKLDLQKMPGKRPADWKDFVPFSTCSLNESQVKALQVGDLTGAFGPLFAKVNLRQPMKLPSGMLELLHRVPLLDPTGGRYGLGLVRAEYDINPQDWFLTCHFVDDQVMPGTLMYECCLHTLRVLLMRMGWVGEANEVVTEPVPGISSRLKCRGQVIATTKLVTYEVSIKELGYGPEPFCIADALMYADGKPIVEITNMTLRMSGLSRERLEEIWSEAKPSGGRKPAIYDKARILSYSNGNPSEGFGEPYRIFDEGTGRVIARLPGPPFQFVDRITEVVGEPFVLKAGAACEAQYEVPPQEWYFRDNRCPRMPFSVLLEIALQPCGWLAAYCGSALTSDVDLSFRNLGGSATQFLAVTPDIGLLTINVTMTNVSQSAGMIIQHYSMKVSCSRGTVYEGTTYFGFFTKEALANQVGMPTAKVPYLTAEQKQLAEVGELPRQAPFPAPMLRMVDRIDGYLPTGGKAGLGLVQGSIKVDPGFWFFHAHFYQDPVWPGSLGLESFLQLAKFVAWKRFGDPGETGWQTTALNAKHNWTYRGQVLPTDDTVTVVLEVTQIDEQARRMTFDGFLTVDGRIIYQMTGFTLE